MDGCPSHSSPPMLLGIGEEFCCDDFSIHDSYIIDELNCKDELEDSETKHDCFANECDPQTPTLGFLT